MVRHVVAALGALIVLFAFPAAPAAAAETGQWVLTQSATVRCLVSADNFPRGGGPMVVCQLTNGQPWAEAPFAASKDGVKGGGLRLNLAVVRGTGEFTFEKGIIAGPASGDMKLDAGQTYRVNGWTIQPDEHRTRFTYDATGHGLLVNFADVRTF